MRWYSDDRKFEKQINGDFILKTKSKLSKLPSANIKSMQPEFPATGRTRGQISDTVHSKKAIDPRNMTPSKTNTKKI